MGAQRQKGAVSGSPPSENRRVGAYFRNWDAPPRQHRPPPRWRGGRFAQVSRFENAPSDRRLCAGLSTQAAAIGPTRVGHSSCLSVEKRADRQPQIATPVATPSSCGRADDASRPSHSFPGFPSVSIRLLPRCYPECFWPVSKLEKTLGRLGAGEAIRTPDPHLGKVMLYP
jgi:hypothetical protein